MIIHLLALLYKFLFCSCIEMLASQDLESYGPTACPKIPAVGAA